MTLGPFGWLTVLCCSAIGSKQAIAQCTPRDSSYHLVSADTAQGFRLASPSAIPRALPGTGEVQVLVDASGRVVGDSTKVMKAPSRQDSLAVASAAAGWRFLPATHWGCPIRSWFSYRIRSY